MKLLLHPHRPANAPGAWRDFSRRLQAAGFLPKVVRDAPLAQEAPEGDRGAPGVTCGEVSRLLLDFYVREVSWWSFTEPEQTIIRKTAREFSGRLRKAGLIGRKG